MKAPMHLRIPSGGILGGDAVNGEFYVPPTPANRRRGTRGDEPILADENSLLVNPLPSHESHASLPCGRRSGAESPSGSGPPTARDKLSMLRHAVLNAPAVNGIVLSVTVLLLLAPFVDPSMAFSWPFFAAEAALTLFFCLEVGLRIVLMRSSFWSSPINALEAVMCVVCVFTMLAMCVATPRKGEPFLVAALRLVAQLARGFTYCYHRRVTWHRDAGPFRMII